MNPVRERAVNKVRELVVQALAGRKARVWLFGSCARGDVWNSSDIDVAIDAEEPLPAFVMADLKESIEASVPYDVDLVDLRRVGQEFRDRVMSEGITWR